MQLADAMSESLQFSCSELEGKLNNIVDILVAAVPFLEGSETRPLGMRLERRVQRI